MAGASAIKHSNLDSLVKNSLELHAINSRRRSSLGVYSESSVIATGPLSMAARSRSVTRVTSLHPTGGEC